METACLRHTEIPHTSRLFSDFQYHFDRLARFYVHHPEDPAAYAAAAKELSYPPERRAALVAALRARNGDSPSLDLLSRPGTVAVVTGQQVGLFSGPAYTVYKALTAARLAEQLTSQGIPAVPIFWVATEDHDFAEVNHSFVFDGEHHPVILRVDGENGTERPVGTIPIDTPPLDRLRKALAAFPFGEEAADLVAGAYQPGATFGRAFQALLERLLGGRGLLFIDPLDDAVRRLAAPLLRDALQDGKNLHAKLMERNRELEAAGYHAQVHLEAKTSLVFLLEGGRRITLRKQNGDYVSKDRRYSAAELAELAEHLSPNALLRPVVQDYILPTVAYVGGPAELAYMAQSQVIYEDLLQRMPVMLARSGFTLLDAKTAKLMNKYGLTLPGFFHGEDAVRETIARKLVPDEVTRELLQLFDPRIEDQRDGPRVEVRTFVPEFQFDRFGQTAGVLRGVDGVKARLLFAAQRLPFARRAGRLYEKCGPAVAFESAFVDVGRVQALAGETLDRVAPEVADRSEHAVGCHRPFHPAPSVRGPGGCAPSVAGNTLERATRVRGAGCSVRFHESGYKVEYG